MKMNKKRSFLVIILALALVLMMGCNSNENNNKKNDQGTETSTPGNTVNETFNYSDGLSENGFYDGVKASDLVEVQANNAMTIPADVHTVTEEGIQAVLDELLASVVTYTEVMDRAIADGDTVNIDFVGSIDGVEFDGGSTNGGGYDVIIGETNFIDDFIEQLIGHKPGEVFDIEVTFPEDYQKEDLAGKDAVFGITINFISEPVTPELTDELVAERWSESHDSVTVEELKATISKDLQLNAVKNYIQIQLSETLTVSSVPEAVRQYQIDTMRQYYTSTAARYGVSADEFVAATQGFETLEAMIEGSEEDIISNAETALIIQAVAEVNNIEVTSDNLSAYFKTFLGLSDYSQVEEIYGLPYLKNAVLQDTVLEYLAGIAVFE